MMTVIRTTVILCAMLIACGAAMAADEQAKTYAERLGWPTGSKVLIFHSDDAGMCHSANMGTIEALENGTLTSTSTMMPCSWVPEFAKYLKAHPEVDNGIHLTFTSEWAGYRWGPLAGKAAVPGLVDEEGCMYGDVGEVVANASPAEVKAELLAQVERAEKMGIPITHLDSHMGTLFAKSEFFLQYLTVGIQKQIPILIAGGHMHYIMQENPEAAQQLKGAGVIDVAWNAGLPVLDDIHTDGYGWKDPAAKKQNTIEFLRTLRPGITEFIVHCTRPGDEFEFISTSGQTRLSDLEIMLDADIKKVIEEEGIILTTWRELKQRRDAVKAEEAPASEG